MSELMGGQVDGRGPDRIRRVKWPDAQCGAVNCHVIVTTALVTLYKAV